MARATELAVVAFAMPKRIHVSTDVWPAVSQCRVDAKMWRCCERKLRAPFDWRARPCPSGILRTIMIGFYMTSRCSAKVNVIRYLADSTRRCAAEDEEGAEQMERVESI
jgi:hypothetical protein